MSKLRGAALKAHQNRLDRLHNMRDAHLIRDQNGNLVRVEIKLSEQEALQLAKSLSRDSEGWVQHLIFSMVFAMLWMTATQSLSLWYSLGSLTITLGCLTGLRWLMWRERVEMVAVMLIRHPNEETQEESETPSTQDPAF